MRSTWWSGLVWAAVLVGCTRLDPDHCANRNGSETCKDLHGRGYCSACEPAQNGCVGAVPPPECRADPSSNMTTEQAGTSSTPDEDEGADPIESGTSEVDDSSSEGGPTSDGNASEETGEPGFCGDGELDPGEACDGEAFDPSGDSCMDYGLDSGTVRCKPGCTIDVSQCVGFDTCNNGTIEDWEECEDGMFGGATCESIPGYIGGELRCDDCLFNTTNCIACVPSGGACQNSDQCCSGGCSLLSTCLG